MDDNLPSDVSIDLNHESQDDYDYDDQVEANKVLVIKKRERGESFNNNITSIP